MKFRSILKIVGALGIAFWVACCFLGLYYAFDGNLVLSITLSLLIAVLLYLSYFLMMKMQDKNTTQGNAKSARTIGVVMLCVYLVVTVCSAFYFNHLVKVLMVEKNKVSEQATNALDELCYTFDFRKAGFHQTSYRQYVEDQTNTYMTYRSSFGYSVKDDDPEIIDFETYMLGSEEHSNDANNYTNLENEVNKDIKEIRDELYHWGLVSFTILDQLHKLEQKKPEWESTLMKYSQAKECSEYPFLAEEPFRGGNYGSKYDCTELTKPLTKATFDISGMAILIMVVLQIVILLPYLLFIKGRRKSDKVVPTESMRSW